MYKSEIAICDGVLKLDVDHVYARSSTGNQSTIAQLLNQNFNQIQTVTAGHSDDCVRQVFRTLCNFYLPPCGNSTHPVPPSSICPEECQMVQDKCQLTWDAVMLFLTLDPIIYCNDTSQLLFPIPHCCTDAGLGLCLVLSLTVTVSISFITLFPTMLALQAIHKRKEHHNGHHWPGLWVELLPSSYWLQQ